MILSLAVPVALWALAALALPLLVHLFNRGLGRALPFADIRFIPAAPAQRLRRLAFSQWPLLLLRCLLVVLLAIFLAGPRLLPDGRLEVPSAVLLSPLALEAGGEETLEEARRIAAERGASLRMLAPGFPEPELGAGAIPGGGASSRLAELQTRIAADTRLLVLVANDPQELSWRQAGLARPVEWQVVGPAVPRPALRVSLRAGPGRVEDSRYLAAALQALAAAGMDLEIESADRPPDGRPADVVFALGTVAGAPAPGQTWIRDVERDTDSGLPAVHEFAGEPFDVKLLAGAPPDSALLLTTFSGEPLASSRQADAGASVLWHSRFHPRFAGVVATGYFPDLVGRLLATAIRGAPPRPPEAGGKDDIGRWLPGLLVVLAWLLERAWARRRAGRVDG